jgi:hypothetical protein
MIVGIGEGKSGREGSHTRQANGEDTAKWSPPRTFTFVSGPRLHGFVGADEVGTSFVPNTFGTDEAK